MQSPRFQVTKKSVRGDSIAGVIIIRTFSKTVEPVRRARRSKVEKEGQSNPRGDTQIVSGLSVSLSTLSAGIFSPGPTPLQPPGGCVCREHYSLSRRLLANPIVEPSPRLTDYIRGQIFGRGEAGRGLDLAKGVAARRVLPSLPSRPADGLDTFHRQDACTRVDRRSADRRESFPQIYGRATWTLRGWLPALMRDYSVHRRVRLLRTTSADFSL